MSIVTVDYLRALPAAIMKQKIDNEIARITGSFRETLIRHAGEGKTSYLYEIPGENQTRQPRDLIHQMHQNSQIPPLTPDQLIAAFEQKFPGCAVSYKETWIDTNANTRVFKKGILIDWS
jgi:hypothetical protein